MTVLVLVRHGQASFDSAHYDRLSALGQEQARTTGRFLAERLGPCDVALLGPRRRHGETLAAMTAAGLECVSTRPDPSLDEFADGTVLLQAARQRWEAAGEAWPADARSRLRLYVGEIRRWIAGEPPAGPTMETYDAFSVRTARWLAQLQQEQPDKRMLVAVTSAGIIAAVVCRALQAGDGRLADVLLAVRNASITTLSIGASRLRLSAFNETAHLPVSQLTVI